jgi:hypothetical protein
MIIAKLEPRIENINPSDTAVFLLFYVIIESVCTYVCKNTWRNVPLQVQSRTLLVVSDEPSNNEIVSDEPSNI